MKAKIFEIKRFAVHDGDGIRTTVFFKGCSLKCAWCHNPEGISMKTELAYFSHKCISCGECLTVCPRGAHAFENGTHIFYRNQCTGCGRCAKVCLGNALTLYGKETTVDELLSVLLQDKAFYDASGGGVTLSGGECLLYADFCAELLKKLKESGVHTAVDTCGFVSQSVLDKIIPYTDIFLYDVKAFNEKTHEKCTGYGNRQILKNLLYLDNLHCKIEIRIPYVPEYNADEIEPVGVFLSKLKNITKIRVLPYHQYASSKYRSLDMENTLPLRLPTQRDVDDAIHILKRFNLTVIEG